MKCSIHGSTQQTYLFVHCDWAVILATGLVVQVAYAGTKLLYHPEQKPIVKPLHELVEVHVEASWHAI